MAHTKLWYKPIGVLSGVVAGAIAGALVKRTWRAIAGNDTTPDAIDERSTWVEVLVGATLQGAVFAVVKAAVDRGSATAVRRLTGHWPT